MNRTRRSQLRWNLAALLVALTPMVAQAQTTACTLGRDLRAALGFGAQELAALGVASNTQSSIHTAAATFCDQNQGTIEPLIATYKSARQAAFLKYESGEDTTTTDEALQTAISALESASSSVITTMRGLLSSEQQTAQARLTANRLLDTSIALLNLTTEQRTALKAAQRTRDAVMRHHKDRKNCQAVASAQETFNATVASALDGSQETQHDAYASAQRENLASAQSTESNLCN